MNNKDRNIKNDYNFCIKDPRSFQKELSQNWVNVKNWKTIFIIQITVLVLINLPQSLTQTTPEEKSLHRFSQPQ